MTERANQRPPCDGDGLIDGSQIQGQSTFTRTDATTGTAATVTFAYEGAGYVVNGATTVDGATGATIVTNQALNPDGSVASQFVSTTSADGLTKTLTFDFNGDGIVDQKQSDVTVVHGDGSRTETLLNETNALVAGKSEGYLLDKTVTETSADGKDIDITRFATGSDFKSEMEHHATDANGIRSVTVTSYDRFGADDIGRRTTTTSAGRRLSAIAA